MFKKYNFILGRSNTGKSKLLQNFTSLFKNSILFDFEANLIPMDLPKNTKYVHTKNLTGVEETLDNYVLDKIKEEVFVFLDNPDIFYIDKKSDLERLYKKYEKDKVCFFTTLSLNSLFIKTDEVYNSETHKRFDIEKENCSIFITESYTKNGEFIFEETNKKHTFLDLIREYKINQILDEE